MSGADSITLDLTATLEAMLQHQAVRRLMPRGIVVRWARDPVSRGARSYRPLYALIAG